MSLPAERPDHDEFDPFEAYQEGDGEDEFELDIDPELVDRVRELEKREGEKVALEVAHLLRRRAWLLEPVRVVTGALCRMALYDGVDLPQAERRPFLREQVERAMESELVRDREDERAGVPVGLPMETRFEHLAASLGVPLELTRAVCVTMNEAVPPTRELFFEAVVMRRPLEEIALESSRSTKELRSSLAEATRNLSRGVWPIDPRALRLDEKLNPFDLMGGRDG